MVNGFFLVAISFCICRGQKPAGVAGSVFCRLVGGGRHFYLEHHYRLLFSPECIYNVVTHNLGIHQHHPGGKTSASAGERLQPSARTQALVWIFFGDGISGVARNQEDKNAFVSGRMDGREIIRARARSAAHFFPHYFQQLLPVLSVAAVSLARKHWMTPASGKIFPPERGDHCRRPDHPPAGEYEKMNG